jgi:hypothetical protein
VSLIDSCIGVDPGPATGLCLLEYTGGQLIGRTVLQCQGSTAVYTLKGLLLAYHGGGLGVRAKTNGKRAGSVEKFVTGRSAGSRGAAADVTRQLVMEFAELLQMFGYAVMIRPAADVKPWASDKRLVAARIADSAKDIPGSLGHGWDAARHCLYGAREAGIAADPLRSKTRGPGAAGRVPEPEAPGWLNGLLDV